MSRESDHLLASANNSQGEYTVFKDDSEKPQRCPFDVEEEVLDFEWEDSKSEIASRFHLKQLWDRADKYPEWQRRLLIREVTSSYIRYKIPLHILEFRITLIAMRLNERIRLAYTTSGAVLLKFYNEKAHNNPNEHYYESHQEIVELVTTTDADLNLAKMVDVEKVADNIVQGQCCFKALKDLQTIRKKPATPWPNVLYIPASVGMAMAYSPLFTGAGLYELLCSMAVALICSTLELYWPVFTRLGLGKAMLLAFISAICVSFFHLKIAQINVMNSILSSIVFHLPGLAITNSVTNVCFGHSGVGAGGFIEVMIVSANLGIGVLGGLNLAVSLSGHSIHPGLPSSWPLPFYAQYIAIVWAVLPTAILFKAKLSHLHFYAVGTFVAFFGTYFANLWFHTGQFSACFGATLTGLLSNVYGKYADYGPSVELMLLSIIAIVPGSVSLNFSTAGDVDTATTLLRDMIVVALGIVTGQFVSCALVPPKRQL